MSWWDGTNSLRDQLTSGVESLKKATQDIANELAEVEQTDEYTEEDQELQYGSNNEEMLRFQQMYDELQNAYNLKEKELNELRSENKINQSSSYKLSDDLTKTQQINKKLRAEHQNATKQIHQLQSKIEKLSKTHSMDQNIASLTESEESEIVHQLSNDKHTLVCFECDYAMFHVFCFCSKEAELSKVKAELHDFKKKTKIKWDGVKSKFQVERQNSKKLEQVKASKQCHINMSTHTKQENKDLKLKLQQLSENQTDNELVDELRAKIKELNESKLQNENAFNEITIKFKEIENKLSESNAKCISFEQEIENDKQRMISLSIQHEQVKDLKALMCIHCNVYKKNSINHW